VHDGILVQAPLPKAMGSGAQQRVFDTIAAAKDVDGFGAESAGLLSQNRPQLVACTPAGIIEMLEREKIQISGKHAVVIGRSDIVGKPMAMLLLHRDATVTICHSKTAGLADLARAADVLVAAIGRPAFVTRDFVKPGATVIDVGINRTTGADGKAHLVGDTNFAECAAVAGAITPVPGGVGPMTIAYLLVNTVRAACASAGLPGEVVKSPTCAPKALANLTAMWPRPPNPTIPTFWPDPTFQRRSGE
jgi:methylenetetrahydrofolate dehydrogenase (NADP+)/methenyltetrahydrofolate cyclohydrolase